MDTDTAMNELKATFDSNAAEIERLRAELAAAEGTRKVILDSVKADRWYDLPISEAAVNALCECSPDPFDMLDELLNE